MQKNILKYTTLVCVFILSVNFSFSQTKQPYEMVIDGVKVIVQPSGNEIVEIQTIIKGGVQNYSAGNAGIESLAMSALTECGTVKDDKNSFKNKLDKVSAQVYGNSQMDISSFNMNCIKMDFDVVWPLYVDALTTPRFDEKEFNRIKQDAINFLRAQASQPDYAIGQYARQVAFAGKNYAKSPEGTEATVSKLTVAETKAYYRSLLSKSRMLIVVVGEIEKDILEKRINDMLAAIPAGKPFILKKEMYAPAKNSFSAQKKDYATNYIQAVTGGPLPGTPDYNAFTLAMRIFYDRNFLEIRTNNGLSYAPYSYFDNGLSPSSNFGVSTTDPNKYIGVVNNLINKTKKQGFTPDEVRNIKTTYITNFYYRMETNSAQAASLASNEVLHNNWRRALTLNNDLKGISVQDLNSAFGKYIKNLTWVYQGDPAKADPVLFTSTNQKAKLPPSKVKVQKKN
ncbi:MAG TPA: pitrilysin family protein [Chitinophagaceae bacterium]|nr:pitrilysin family protein [Chitinophagaceae bacterium]